MKNVIYQFVLVPNGKDRFGLIFSEECETYNTPVFAFLTNNANGNLPFKFPGEINGEYQEFELQPHDFYLDLRTNYLIDNLRFTYFVFPDDEINFYKRFLQPKYYPRSPLKYIGDRSEIINEKDEFQIIVPCDILLLDKLYRENKFCLIGYTPTFNGSKE